MTTEKLTKLEQKIRELVPRLRGLSFEGRFVEKGLSETVGTPIDHPITLEAVLEAMGDEYACNGNGDILSHMGDNERGWQTTGCPKCFLLSEWCECEPQFEVKWQLGKPWEEQGEELYEFLFKLFNLEECA